MFDEIGSEVPEERQVVYFFILIPEYPLFVYAVDNHVENWLFAAVTKQCVGILPSLAEAVEPSEENGDLTLEDSSAIVSVSNVQNRLQLLKDSLMSALLSLHFELERYFFNERAQNHLS